MGRLSQPEDTAAVKLTLLIVRAGENDSLKWWDDDALSEAGRFALARVFPRTPGSVAIRLAFRAALERHRGVLSAARVQEATTLLDLFQTDLGTFLGEVPPGTAVRPEPIVTVDELGRLFQEVVPGIATLDVPRPSPQGLVDLTDFVARVAPGLAARAAWLAAGYLRGQLGKPVIPYILVGNSGST